MRLQASVVVCTGLALGCGSDAPSQLVFQYNDPVAAYAGEFANGDFVLWYGARGLRMQLNAAAVNEALPGVDCSWLAPAPQGAEFIRCAHFYQRAAGQPWQRMEVPVDTREFLGQANDGARYFQLRSGAFVGQASGGAVVELPEVTAIEASAYGHFVARVPGGVVALQNGGLGVRLPEPEFPPIARGYGGVAPFIDEAGFYYVARPDGTYDRYALATGDHAAAWISAPAGGNPWYWPLGVSSAGKIFAISEANRGVAHGVADNAVELGALMSRGHGEREWQQAGPSFYGTGYLSFEQRPFGLPARGGRWWLFGCISNCAQVHGAAQTQVVRWQPEGAASVPSVVRTFQTHPNEMIAAAVPNAPVHTHAVKPNQAGCTLAPRVLGMFPNVVPVMCPSVGKHRVTIESTQPQTKASVQHTIELDVRDVATLPRQGARRITLSEGHADEYLLIATDGTVRWRAGAQEASVPGVAAAVSLSGRISDQNHSDVMTADGAVFDVATVFPPTAAQRAVPPALMIHGGYMIGRDANVYPLVDNPTAVPDIDGAIALHCELLYPAGMARETCYVVAADGRMWMLERLPAGHAVQLQPRVDPMVDRVAAGGHMLSRDNYLYQVATGSEMATAGYRVGPALRDFTGVTRTGVVSGTGSFYVPVDLVVTQAGEAWAIAAFADGINNFGVSLPPGRTAVAVEAARSRIFVWLDDGQLGYAELPTVQALAGPALPVPWQPLALAGLAVPSVR